jgi:hypothetical protein
LLALGIGWHAAFPPALSALDSGAIAWIAFAAAGLLVVAALELRAGTAAGSRRLRWAARAMALALLAEPLAHRVASDAMLLDSLAGMKRLQPADPDYSRTPRRLVYRPERERLRPPPPLFRTRYVFSRDYWSFVGRDPCSPWARSDSYARGVAEALLRAGVTIQALGSGSFDLPPALAEAFGCGSPKLTFEGEGGATITVDAFGANRVAVTVDAAGPGRLVYRDAYHPAWRATVNDIEVGVESTQPGFKAVVLPRGQSAIALQFEPSIGQSLTALIGVILASIPVLVAASYSGTLSRQLSARHP